MSDMPEVDTIEVNGKLYVSAQSVANIIGPITAGLEVLLTEKSKPKKAKRTRRTKAEMQAVKKIVEKDLQSAPPLLHPAKPAPEVEAPSNPGALAVDKKSKKGKVWAE